MNRRTSVSLPGDLLRRLVHEARVTGRSASAIVREALSRYFEELPEPELPSFVGIGDSGETDTSERAEELLAGRFRRPSE